MIEIRRSAIDREQVVASVLDPAYGALVVFDGVVRNHARGRKVQHLFYDAYSPMALREMELIRADLQQRWPGTVASIVHRVGRLEIGESSVVIAVAAPHRGEAFEACRYAIDRLKTTVPIWKKEVYDSGEVWIEGHQE